MVVIGLNGSKVTAYIQRIAQMTQKTNQFNLTTKRYTDADIRGFMEKGWKIWSLSVSDRFGDSGITGCVMVDGTEIDTFLLSCRILGKGIEDAFIKSVLGLLQHHGVESVRASYLPTQKNKQVANFYENNGFDVVGEEDDGVKYYKLALENVNLDTPDYYHITIK